MDSELFKEVVKDQFTRCCDMLRIKEALYSDGQDRLIQFKLAAELCSCTPVTALQGMMVKHTTKLFQMINEYEMDENKHTTEQWNETLTDQINYLFLLRAVLREEGLIDDNL